MRKEERECFAIRVQQLRKLTGETQKMLADAIHISRSCLANFESQNRIPSEVIIEEICAHYGVSRRFLLGRRASDAIFPTYKTQADASKNILDLSSLSPPEQNAVFMLYRFLMHQE